MLVLALLFAIRGEESFELDWLRSGVDDEGNDGLDMCKTCLFVFELKCSSSFELTKVVSPAPFDDEDDEEEVLDDLDELEQDDEDEGERDETGLVMPNSTGLTNCFGSSELVSSWARFRLFICLLRPDVDGIGSR